MSVPLSKIIDHDGNVYEITKISIEQANKLSIKKDKYRNSQYTDIDIEALKKNQYKTVSAALNQVYSNEVEYEK